MFDIPQPRLLLNDCECARLVCGVTCVCPQYDHPNYRPDKMYCIVLVSKLTEPCPAQPGLTPSSSPNICNWCPAPSVQTRA